MSVMTIFADVYNIDIMSQYYKGSSNHFMTGTVEVCLNETR